MSQSAVQRLYLMEVGSMPEYQIPIVCYLVQMCIRDRTRANPTINNPKVSNKNKVSGFM